MKFTFRKVKKVGRWRSFELNCTTIKLNKKEVGQITEINYQGQEQSKDENFSVRLAEKKEKTEKNPADPSNG